MILEAFSKHLQSEENRDLAPERVLYQWLFLMLCLPPDPNDQVSKVIHTEIEMIWHGDDDNETYVTFEGRSSTGKQLLKSLVDYCRSYDHWQFTKWLHHVQASDFQAS